MKKYIKYFHLILFLFMGTLVYSQSNYEQKWKQVAENYSNGLYKSNLPLILEIQNQSIKEENDVQLIRSLKAEFAIVKDTKDDTQNDLSSQFFKKILSTENRLKGNNLYLFQVLKMEFVNDYFSQNNWRITQRTNSDNGKLDEIELWTKLDFKNYFNKEFAYFETKDSAFKKINLQPFSPIFEGDRDFQFYNSLYEWKTSQYIAYLRGNYLFTPDEQTVNNVLVGKLYDQLVTQNVGNSKLYFQHQKINFLVETKQIKDELSELKSIYNSQTEGDYKLFIAYDIANKLVGEYKKKDAVEFIRSAKAKYTQSKFLNSIINLENDLTQPTIRLLYQYNIQPDKPIQIFAEHTNFSVIKLEIYKVEDLDKNLKYINGLSSFSGGYNDYDYYGNLNIDSKIESKLIRTEEISLPDTGDFQTKKTSIDLKPLERGLYYVRYKNFENEVEYMLFFVSDSRAIVLNKDTDDHQFQWVNSDNGVGNSVDKLDFIDVIYYNNKENRTNFLRTESDGKFKDAHLKFRNNEYQNFQSYLFIDQKTNNISLFSNSVNRNYNTVYPHLSQIFLDRAIYRPGQIVYFKAILTNLIDKKDMVVPDFPLQIAMYDANRKQVGIANFKTNAFGSLQGNFTIPKGLLTGQFSIGVIATNYSNNKYFAVEEYKRPKFEIIFDPVKEEYKYGQTIELKGKAISYSGIPLGNADVNFEITKQNIRWRYFWWYPQNYETQNSILGKATTNEKGEFTIKVDLKKDEKIEGIQIDNYEINASVTDLSGETQTEKRDVKVATVSHYIEAEKIGEVFSSDELLVDVKTKNYNDQILNKSYKVELFKLIEPARIIRNNFKTAVQNLPKLSKSEFIAKFPHDLFDVSEEQVHWKKESVLSKTNPTEKLSLGKLEPAYYQLVLSNIEGKDTIKSEQIFEVWSKDRLAKDQFPFLKILKPKNDFERGEKATIYAYSAIPNAIGIVYIQDGNGTTQTTEQKFKNGILKYTLEIPTDENSTKVNYQIAVIGYYDLQNESAFLKIKPDQAPVKIELITFRDKILPNSKEKWTIKVSGDKKEKMVAEVLANMYDKSLDKFAANTYNWQNIYRPVYNFKDYGNQASLKEIYDAQQKKYLNFPQPYDPDFNWFSENFFYELMKEYDLISKFDSDGDGILDVDDACPTIGGVSQYQGCPKPRNITVMETVSSAKMSSRMDKATETDENSEEFAEKPKEEEKIKVRENLNETAFFYPNLVTDKDGNISFEFEGPEALTKWKMMFLAHTKDGRASTLEKDVITQKDFSVTPNYPRFLREGDELILQSKISSLLERELSGEATLQILDAFTNENITSQFKISNEKQNFNLKGKSSNVVSWKLKTPYGKTSAIIVQVLAKAGAFSDGEQSPVAILPNRMLVTEAQPIFVKEGQTKTFTLKNLKETTSKTVVNYANTLELSTNPVWEIIFALPDLNAYLNISSDGVFNAWFADVVASEIFKANPKMEKIFAEYKDKDLLKSNLEKNQELKQLLLEETPWVFESENEEDQMKRVARLFDANEMRKTVKLDWERLQRYQNSDGGFPWLPGYPSSYYSSVYILNNLGKIDGWLKGNTEEYQKDQEQMVSRLIRYIDNEIELKWDEKKDNPWSNFAIDYLYSRNFWEKKYPLSGKGLLIKKQMMEKGKVAKLTDFTFFGVHRVALLFDAYGMKKESQKILTYLKETTTETETQGIYWKSNLSDWGWYDSKTINHAGAIEALAKLSPQDVNLIEETKIWLATQKEVNSWGTSRATAEIIYVFMNSGKSWTSDEADKATVVWGGKNINPEKKASGYLKQSIKSEDLNKDLATISVTKQGPGIAQGGIFWQYYEDLDKIKSSESYISITKEFYKKIKTVDGEQLVKIAENAPIKIGDVVTIRMILNTDRPMQFVHLKDMRAAGFEPIDVLSTRKFENSLYYYQATKDASTNFYIENMPKGNYVFDYNLVANASGIFSSGIATLQNYYAPQMNAHSEGREVNIVEK